MHTGLGTPHSDFVDARLPSQSDPNIGQLRTQIKKVMIPLLIRIFELKFAVQQANTPPSRLQKQQTESVDEILIQLKSLEEDLKLLQLWCGSCQRQVERALNEVVSQTSKPRFTQAKPDNNPLEQPNSNWLRKFLKK